MSLAIEIERQVSAKHVERFRRRFVRPRRGIGFIRVVIGDDIRRVVVNVGAYRIRIRRGRMTEEADPVTAQIWTGDRALPEGNHAQMRGYRRSVRRETDHE